MYCGSIKHYPHTCDKFKEFIASHTTTFSSLDQSNKALLARARALTTVTTTLKTRTMTGACTSLGQASSNRQRQRIG